jgi:hypothetical protein
MNVPLIIVIVFVAVSATLIIFALRKAFRLVTVLITIVALALVSAALVLSYDLQQFQSKLSSSDKLFVLAQDNELRAAFVHQNEPTPLLLNNTSSEREALARGDTIGLQDGRALVIVMTPEAFADVGQVKLDDKSMDAETLLGMLAKDSTRLAYVEEIRRRDHLPDDEPVILADITEDRFRGLLFAALTNEYLHSQSLARSVNEGTVRVYPESPTTWMMERAPYWVLKYLLQVEAT